jgi:hypothetical protein
MIRNIRRDSIDSFSYIKNAFGDLNNNDRISYQLLATDKAVIQQHFNQRNEGTRTDSPNVPTYGWWQHR